MSHRAPSSEDLQKAFDSIISTIEFKYKDKIAIQSLSKEKKESIIKLREAIQVRNDYRQYGSNPQQIASYFIEQLETNAQFVDIIAFYEWICHQLRFNQKLEELEESLVIEVLMQALMQYGQLKHDSAKKLYLLHIFKILTIDYLNLFSNQNFLLQFDQSDAAHSLAEMLVPEQVEINSLILSLMDSLFWLSGDGLRMVLEGFEIVQKNNNHPSKFTCLANILSQNKSSIFTSNVAVFLNSLCAAFKNHFNSNTILDDIESSGLLNQLCDQAVKKIREGRFFIEDCSFAKEDYHGVAVEELFFVNDYERRNHFTTQFFYDKVRDQQEFQTHTISVFIQIHELQQKNKKFFKYDNQIKIERLKEREEEKEKQLEDNNGRSKLNQIIDDIKEEDEEEEEKVKGNQKQVKLEERFKSEVQMREKEKIEQSQKQNQEVDYRKSFGRQNAVIGKEKSEEKSQLWQAQQEIQKLQKEIEKLNSKMKNQEPQDQISQNILLKQQQIQGQLLDKQRLEEKEKALAKYKQENMQLLTKVSELEQLRQKATDQLEVQKQQNQLQIQKANSVHKSEELSEKIKKLNEQLSNLTFQHEEYKQTKEKEVSQLNLNISALKSKHSVSEENKNEVLSQNVLMNEKLQRLDAICKQLDAHSNGQSASKESIVKMIESQFMQEIAELKEQNQSLQQQLKKQRVPLSAEKSSDLNTLNSPLVSTFNGLKSAPPPPPPMPNVVLAQNIPQPPTLPGLGQQPPLSVAPPPPPMVGMNLPSTQVTLTAPPPPPTQNGIPQAPTGMVAPPPPPQLNGIPSAPQRLGSAIPPPPPPMISGSQQSGNAVPPPPPPPMLGGLPQAPNNNGAVLPPPPPSGIPPPPPVFGSAIPPPPPVFGSSIPPPPPPFGVPQAPVLGGAGGIPPPPPPGGVPMPPSLGMPGLPPMAPLLPGMSMVQPQQGMKQKKNPGIPMKGVNWSTLKFSDIQGSIWEKIKDEDISLEEDYLKQEFCQKATIQKAVNQQNPESSAAKKITILTAERQQSVLLILGKIKLKGEQVVDLLLTCNKDKLTPSLIDSLLAALPNEQEMTQIQAYDGKVENLGDAEKYFKALEKINGYEERIQALKFKNLYLESQEFLFSKLKLLTQFFDQLQGDEKIVKILENALAVGNYMNGTGFKGGAWGFKFSNIDKMTEVKSLDGKLNLLMYLINRIEKQEGKEIVKVDEDLKILEECSKTPVSQLVSEIADLKRGIKSLEKSIKVQTADESDKIKETIEPFYQQIQPEVLEMEKQVKELESRYKTIAEFFCEDPRKMPSDEFAKQIFLFKRSCIQAKLSFKNLKR